MYESEVYLNIMERCLNRCRDDLAKHEGSILWEALGPVAQELELVYNAFDLLQSINYPTTANRSYLVRWAESFSVTPFDPTPAILQAEFIVKNDKEIPIGSRFIIDGLFYKVVERETDRLYKIECEENGTIGNRYFGQLLPIDYVQGFESAQIVGLLIPGEDEEDTEEFRARFKRHLNNKSFGWNEAQYIEETTALQGVGDCKVLRCPRGKGTVDVIIIDSEYNAPSAELIESVQQTLHPKDPKIPPEIDTCGLGLTAIGHDVLVYGVREREIEIGLSLTLKEGYSFEDINTLIEEKIEEYFLELKKDWGNKDHYADPITERWDPHKRFITIYLSQIERALLEIDAILDYDRFASEINHISGEVSLDLEFDEIPVLKGVYNSG